MIEVLTVADRGTVWNTQYLCIMVFALRGLVVKLVRAGLTAIPTITQKINAKLPTHM